MNTATVSESCFSVKTSKWMKMDILFIFTKHELVLNRILRNDEPIHAWVERYSNKCAWEKSEYTSATESAIFWNFDECSEPWEINSIFEVGWHRLGFTYLISKEIVERSEPHIHSWSESMLRFCKSRREEVRTKFLHFLIIFKRWNLHLIHLRRYFVNTNSHFDLCSVFLLS